MHVSHDPRDKPFPLPAEALSSDRLFNTPAHGDVLAELSGALAKAPGFSALTGEAGTGKTTLVRQAVAGWPGAVSVAKDGPALAEALAALDEPRTGGAPGILVIDDAHAMPSAGLAGLATLRPEAMPHVILVGQSELWGRLQNPGLAALRDRIQTRCVLFPLSYGEAERYVEHLFRLGGAGPDRILGDRDRHAMLLAARGNIRRINADLLARLAPGLGRAAANPQAGAARAARQGDDRPGTAGWLLGTAAVAVVALGSLFAVAPELIPDLVPRAAPVRVDDGRGPAPPAELPEPPAASTAEGGRPAPEPGPPSPEPVLAAPEPDPVPAAPPVPIPAPPAPDAAVTPVLPGPGTLPDGVVAILVRRGEALMELRDVSAARRFFERAALEGSGTLRARAALHFAATYDPGEGGSGAWIEDTDAAVALAWYSLAASLGSPEAPAAARRLSGTGPAAVPRASP